MEKRRETASAKPANERQAADKQAITLKVLGRNYRFTIDRDREEVYRLAERETSKSLADIMTTRMVDWDEADYLAMAVLTFAIDNIDVRRSREVGGEELQRLAALDEELGTYLDTRIE